MIAIAALDSVRVFASKAYSEMCGNTKGGTPAITNSRVEEYPQWVRPDFTAG